MNALKDALTLPLRLFTPRKGRRVRRPAPLAVSPMASPDYDTKPLERSQ